MLEVEAAGNLHQIFTKQIGSDIGSSISFIIAFHIDLGCDSFVYMFLGSMSLHLGECNALGSFFEGCFVEMFPEVSITYKFPVLLIYASVTMFRDHIEVLVCFFNKSLAISSYMHCPVRHHRNDASSDFSASGASSKASYVNIKTNSVFIFFDV